MIKTLGQFKLMNMNYDHFNALVQESEEIFKKWDKEFTLFKTSMVKVHS